MAFHPIVDLTCGAVWGYEALVRGTEGQSAFSILSQVDEKNRYKFDQACRVKAIELAGRLFGPDLRLSINFMPNAVYEPAACIRSSLHAASRVGFNPSRIMFEFTENEHMSDPDHVGRIVEEYRRIGFTTALDDFGAGYAGLNLLARFQPDLVKIDMELIRGIATSPARQAIIRGIVSIARDLNLKVIAEGIETDDELRALRSAGISLFQGYLFARPLVEGLPPVMLPVAIPASAAA
ncbi:MAG TPA: EAL domain-containing protein [Microvirga sp.]|jgi:EAL domain-containing protein (putative c-di-GMP-specific phosphodiesterase class I)|nr:EAL domain-containing protein [Microvirga sp.]